MDTSQEMISNYVREHFVNGVHREVSGFTVDIGSIYIEGNRHVEYRFSENYYKVFSAFFNPLTSKLAYIKFFNRRIQSPELRDLVSKYIQFEEGCFNCFVLDTQADTYIDLENMMLKLTSFDAQNYVYESVCFQCGYSYDLTRIDDTMYCSECYSCCYECSSYIVSDDIYTVNDNCYCEDCYNDLNYCDNCEERYTGDRCSCNCDDYGDSSSIKSYGYKPRPNFKQLRDNRIISDNYADTDVHYYGLEIELAANTGEYSIRPNQLVEQLTEQWGDMFYCKRDCSIGAHGVEIVSHPMTYDVFISINWKKFFKITRECGYHYDKSCGLHVHTNRDATSMSAITLLAVWLYENKATVIEVAGRDSSYGRVVDHTRNCGTYYGNDRYNAINMENTNTYEFRYMGGVSKADSLIRKVSFIHESVMLACNCNTESGYIETTAVEVVNKLERGETCV
jgi:hypothetical protein